MMGYVSMVKMFGQRSCFGHTLEEVHAHKTGPLSLSVLTVRIEI